MLPPLFLYRFFRVTLESRSHTFAGVNFGYGIFSASNIKNLIVFEKLGFCRKSRCFFLINVPVHDIIIYNCHIWNRI